MLQLGSASPTVVTVLSALILALRLAALLQRQFLRLSPKKRLISPQNSGKISAA